MHCSLSSAHSAASSSRTAASGTDSAIRSERVMRRTMFTANGGQAMHSNANPQYLRRLNLATVSLRRNLNRARNVDPYNRISAGMTKYRPSEVNMPAGKRTNSAIPPVRFQGASSRCFLARSDHERSLASGSASNSQLRRNDGWCGANGLSMYRESPANTNPVHPEVADQR